MGFAHHPSGEAVRRFAAATESITTASLAQCAGLRQRVQDDQALPSISIHNRSAFSREIWSAELYACFAPGVRPRPEFRRPASPLSGQCQRRGHHLEHKLAYHPLFQQQFSLGVQQQVVGIELAGHGGWPACRRQRQLMAQSLRSTSPTSPYISCPGNNRPRIVTDPLKSVSDQVTPAASAAKSWYDGLLVSAPHRPGRSGPAEISDHVSYTLRRRSIIGLPYQSCLCDMTGVVKRQPGGEGSAGARTEKGYAASDERNRLTAYGELQCVGFGSRRCIPTVPAFRRTR